MVESAKAPRTLGKDWNFFTKKTITATSFSEECDVLINVKNLTNLTLHNEGSVVVEYSFNGNTVHGDMTPDTATASLLFLNRRVSKIWFRVASGSTTVRVESW